ncbi:MAG: hypothetical protein ACLUHE_08485 [Christensenellales bacterium]
MDGWKIRRAVDLQEDSRPVERLRALATLSSRQAHGFADRGSGRRRARDLTGMQPWLSMILPGTRKPAKAGGQGTGQRGDPVAAAKICYSERATCRLSCR